MKKASSLIFVFLSFISLVSCATEPNPSTGEESSLLESASSEETSQNSMLPSMVESSTSSGISLPFRTKEEQEIIDTLIELQESIQSVKEAEKQLSSNNLEEQSELYTQFFNEVPLYNGEISYYWLSYNIPFNPVFMGYIMHRNIPTLVQDSVDRGFSSIRMSADIEELSVIPIYDVQNEFSSVNFTDMKQENFPYQAQEMGEYFFDIQSKYASDEEKFNRQILVFSSEQFAYSTIQTTSASFLYFRKENGEWKIEADVYFGNWYEESQLDVLKDPNNYMPD